MKFWIAIVLYANGSMDAWPVVTRPDLEKLEKEAARKRLDFLEGIGLTDQRLEDLVDRLDISGPWRYYGHCGYNLDLQPKED